MGKRQGASDAQEVLDKADRSTTTITVGNDGEVNVGIEDSVEKIVFWLILAAIVIPLVKFAIYQVIQQTIFRSLFRKSSRENRADFRSAVIHPEMAKVRRRLEEDYDAWVNKSPGDEKIKSDESVGDLFNERFGNGRREPSISDRNLSEDLMDKGQAYIAKEQLMSPSEQFAYKVIEYKYNDRFYVFSQVRVVDIIKPNLALHKQNSREFISLFRQLSQWHFDFVLCYREDFRICCAIELDDPSHQQKARQKRDRILNRACEVAGVRLERMKLNYKTKMVERA